jgi:hypothetical protein
MPLFPIINHTSKQCKLTQFSQKHCYVSLQKPYTLAGFDPGYYVLQADAMTTAPRRQGFSTIYFPYFSQPQILQ